MNRDPDAPPPLKKASPPPPLVNPAFITGSHAYGTPTEKSDVDLVVLVEKETMQALVALFGDDDTKADLADYEDLPTAQLRMGNLNLIVASTVRHYRQWLKGTRQLIAQKPVTRDQAKLVFKTIREEENV